MLKMEKFIPPGQDEVFIQDFSSRLGGMKCLYGNFSSRLGGIVRPKYNNLLAYFSSKQYIHKASIRRLPRSQISLEIGKKLYNEFHIHMKNVEHSVVYVFFIS
jgi:ERCC4-type nuclease